MRSPDAVVLRGWAQEYKRGGGITRSDAQTLIDLHLEIGKPFGRRKVRIDRGHANSDVIWDTDHFHFDNMHIPLRQHLEHENMKDQIARIAMQYGVGAQVDYLIPERTDGLIADVYVRSVATPKGILVFNKVLGKTECGDLAQHGYSYSMFAVDGPTDCPDSEIVDLFAHWGWGGPGESPFPPESDSSDEFDELDDI